MDSCVCSRLTCTLLFHQGVLTSSSLSIRAASQAFRLTWSVKVQIKWSAQARKSGPAFHLQQTRRALDVWRDWPASKNNCQWNNIPTPRSHSLSAFRSRVWLCQTSGVYAHVVCENVTSPAMSLYFFFFFSAASDELADRHIIGTLFKFCIVSSAEQPFAAGRLALIYCLSNLPSKLRHQTRQSTVPPRVARSLADSSVRLRAGYADNEGNVNWNLKSDLKVSPCVEQLLPLPLILRLEWIRHHTGFGVCLKKEGNDRIPPSNKHL